MCGIVGLIKKDNNFSSEEQSILQAMNDAIIHRGPDGEGQYIENKVGLGHRRLSIIDVSGGDQPMTNTDKSVYVVFNGEIYNYLPLKEELSSLGYEFKTQSDTEVLIHAWSEWAEKSVEKLQGMFAYALWDKRQKCLFIARDRLGIKPLYYSWLSNGDLIFGSELKALLVHPGLDKALNLQAIEDYFAFGYIPDPKSIFEKVYKLKAGHTLRIDLEKQTPIESKEYWDITFNKNAGDYSQDELKGVLQQSVNDHLMSEVPLGAFLSGGVDSSAVVAMMATSNNKETVRTCSISFADEQFNEESYANEVASLFETDHFSQQVDINDISIIDTLINSYDEPFADSSALPTYKLCELARKQVTVALSGDGGDEIFAGYSWYSGHVNRDKIKKKIPSLIQTAISSLNPLFEKNRFNLTFSQCRKLSKLGMSAVEAFTYSTMITDPAYRRYAYTDTFLKNIQGYDAKEVIKYYGDKIDSDDALVKAQYIDMKVYMCNDILTKVDRASMAHSLEVRVPFIDHNVMEWVCANINSKDKIVNGELKAPLKKAFENILPNGVLYRPKMGFSIPVKKWFQTSLKKDIDKLLNDSVVLKHSIFDREKLTKVVNHHYSGKYDHSAFLWALLMFEGSMRHLGVD